MAMGWLSSVFIIFQVGCFMVSLAIPKSNSTDQAALLAFKTHITFDPFNVIAQNWSTATSFCHWAGVTCSSRHHRVISLNLSNMQLQGSVPPQVGNLSFLLSLNLSYNSFHGVLPGDLANLRRLKFINLGNNSFDGEIPSRFAVFPRLQHLLLGNSGLKGTIPSSLFNITTLETLVLRGNSFQGNIPEEIGNSSSLQIFLGRYNKLSGQIPSDLFKCGKLQYLGLHDNKFTGIIPREIGNLTKLIWLALGNNNLTGEIPGLIGRLASLQIVGLEVNSLHGSIPVEIGNCKSLRTMNFFGNNLAGRIPREIGNCTLINNIYLQMNSLTGVIPHEIGGLHSLQQLNLQSNYLSGPIPSPIFNLSEMKIMSLMNNRLSGHLPSSIGLYLPNLEGLFLGLNVLTGPIPDSICNASQLINLDLAQNSLSGFIPDSLENLRNLQLLNLMGNSLTSRYSSPELSFLSSLTNCKNLVHLELSYNPLNITLPGSMGNLSTSLESISAVGCRIKGTIPKDIGNLSNLIDLTLQDNELTGSIPIAIGRLEDLQRLAVRGNSLQGNIPQELCHLRRLAFLFVARNRLFGSIPSCLSNLTSLRELYLASNGFVGTIPSTLWGIQEILEVDLSSNSLSGSLSLEISNSKVLSILDLSRNQISGEIPSTIGGLKDLTYLSLSTNRLQGPIPQSFGDLSGLESLDLSNNSLSGEIPKSLQKLLYLERLNVSFNKLQGEIPSGGPFANFSVQSFLGNKALCSSTRTQFPPCKYSTRRQSKAMHKIVLRYVMPGMASLIVLLAIIIVIFIRFRKKNVKLPSQAEMAPSGTTWRRISYRELELATEGFQESNLLGTGSLGSVYKGNLSDGTIVAVKVFNLQIEEAFASFDNECEFLRNLRHRKIVKIISSCCNLDFKALVLDFMPNWSLEKWLYSHNYFLDIHQRLNIIIDVASALEYLHHGNSVPVVHCDLKPSNVLLDGDMVAHVADFGIAKLLGEGDAMTQTITLATIGYMAPEYGSEGVVSVKGDVYSYGILLMETFTRRKPTDEMSSGEMSLKHWVQRSLPDAVIGVVDANLLRREEHFVAKLDCITSILDLSLKCSADLPEERIGIKDALAALEKIKSKLQIEVLM